MKLMVLLYLIVVAFLVSLFFTYILKTRGPWGNFWAFFTVVLLGILSANLWITPAGPFYREIYWVPPLAAGFFIALILAATTPPGEKRTLENRRPVNDKMDIIAIGPFFWALMLFLLIVIMAGFLYTV